MFILRLYNLLQYGFMSICFAMHMQYGYEHANRDLSWSKCCKNKSSNVYAFDHPSSYLLIKNYNQFRSILLILYSFFHIQPFQLLYCYCATSSGTCCCKKQSTSESSGFKRPLLEYTRFYLTLILFYLVIFSNVLFRILFFNKKYC